MTSLYAHLAERDPRSLLWLQGEGTHQSGEFLRQLDQAIAPTQFENRRVALDFESNLQMAMHLAALDGVAGEILLLPRELPESTAAEFMQRAGIEIVVSDRTETDRAGAHPPLFGSGPRVSRERQYPGRSRLENETATRWVIPTSGTTGTPKLVAHTFASLARSIKTDKGRGGGFRWGLLYDLTRFAGLQVFLQAFCGGSALIFPKHASHTSLVVQDLAGHACNALSATPSMWRKLLMTEEIGSLPLKLISLGGEIADQRVLEALRAKFPSAKITHIYASTEAGVGFSVADGFAGFPASYLHEPPAGAQIRVDDTGFLHLRPAVGRQRYIGDQEEISDADGWIDTGDLVRREGDRYLFLGRENGAINVGGNKVQPQEIEQIILSVTGVAQVRVFGRTNPILGSLVHAQVVPAPNSDRLALEALIQHACDEQLAAYKRPACIHFVTEIALTTAGKTKH